MLYAGLMVTNQGLKVLEYNVRFGDPECQPLLMRLQSDLLDLLEATVDGSLDVHARGGSKLYQYSVDDWRWRWRGRRRRYPPRYPCRLRQEPAPGRQQPVAQVPLRRMPKAFGARGGGA